jgi:hypothetical protein
MSTVWTGVRQDTAALAAEFAAVDYFGVVIKPSAQRCSLDTARARTSLHISLTASAYPIGKNWCTSWKYL